MCLAPSTPRWPHLKPGSPVASSTWGRGSGSGGLVFQGTSIRPISELYPGAQMSHLPVLGRTLFNSTKQVYKRTGLPVDGKVLQDAWEGSYCDMVRGGVSEAKQSSGFAWNPLD